nr:hypothetical protein [Diaphorobacter sp. HDW4A]
MKIWLAAAFTTASFAALAAAPAGEQTFVCKDGTSVSAAASKGACKGHKGIDKDATAKAGGGVAAAPAAAAPAPQKPTAAAPAVKADNKVSTAPAPGGGAGKVWANDSTKVYHCQGDKYYGTTKHGEYMSEADAKAKGMHASHNKACTA